MQSSSLIAANMNCFACARNDNTNRHRPPPGRRNAPPDDRLQRAIQYSETVVVDPRSRGVLDTPHARGMTAFAG